MLSKVARATLSHLKLAKLTLTAVSAYLISSPCWLHPSHRIPWYHTNTRYSNRSFWAHVQSAVRFTGDIVFLMWYSQSRQRQNGKAAASLRTSEPKLLCRHAGCYDWLRHHVRSYGETRQAPPAQSYRSRKGSKVLISELSDRKSIVEPI